MVKVTSVRKVSESPLRVGDIRMGSPDSLYLLEGVSVHNSSIVNINIAMGCPSFCSFCFVTDSDQLMELSDGSIKPLNLVAPGDRIKTPTGESKVLKVAPTGNKEAFLYRTQEGVTLEVTPDHPVLTHDGNSFLISSIQMVFENKWPVYSAEVSKHVD